MKALTVAQFFKRFPDDETCLEHIFNVRYSQNHTCPKCKHEAKWYRIKAERAYSCQWCGHHLHPTVGTLFENSRTGLQFWFYAIYLFTTSRHGIPAKEFERQLGVTYKTAWRMGHEIRKHMALFDGEDPLSSNVEVDETYIGGKSTGGKRDSGAPGKTVVFGMIQLGGDVMTKVATDAQTRTLQLEIIDNVEQGSTVSLTNGTPTRILIKWDALTTPSSTGPVNM